MLREPKQPDWEMSLDAQHTVVLLKVRAAAFTLQLPTGTPNRTNHALTATSNKIIARPGRMPITTHE